MKKIKVVKAAPEDAEKILAYSKIIGGETENLLYGPEGINTTLEQEKEFIKNAADSKRRVLFVAKYDDEVVGVADFSSVEHPRSDIVAVWESRYEKICGAKALAVC